jgi:membrane-bound lytic murein transglycosylase D
MKTNLFKVFSLTAIIAFFSASFVQAQPTSGSGLRNVQPDQAGEEKIKEVTGNAGVKFKEGLLSLEDNRRADARQKFDEAVEVFLMSNINVTKNDKLSKCYNQMIETIYRMEFPSPQQPNIRGVSETCGWKIDGQLADNVAKISQSLPQNTSASNAPLIKAVVDDKSQGDFQQVGFLDQRFLPTAGDELAAPPPELAEEDSTQVINNPEIQQQFIKVEQAIANKSFGFSFRLHPFVQQYIGYYRGRGRQTMEIGLYRSGMFTRMARRIFREEGVPENIVWLGQVESAWKPTARSWAAAAGLWQFIPGTGSRYNLRINGYMDERNSFEKATRASAQYLKFLANRYGGNWELGMAAYNCGEGNVDRAIRRAGVADFWAAYPYLPKETRNYVPNILAVILIANNPNAYGFGHVRPAPQLDYEILRVPPSTSLTTIAQLSDTSVDYIRYLNPEFRTNMTPPEPYMVRVPTGRGNAVAAVLRKTSVVQGGNNVAVARVMAGETQQQLINRTGASQVAVVPGGKAVVQQNGNNVKPLTYNRPTNSPAAAPTTKGLQIVKAKQGDTIAKIAARFGISPATLANLNGMTSIDTPLSVGREIRVQAR